MPEGKTSRASGVANFPGEEGWIRHSPGEVYRVEVRLARTGDTWSAMAPALSGVRGAGTSEEEAIDAITRQLTNEIARHKGSGKIPWSEPSAAAPTELIRWVFIRLAEVANGQPGPISKTPGVCGGDACIHGTRLTVWGLEQWRRLGWDDERILVAYPQLKASDLTAAWDYVASHREEIDRLIQENEEA